MAKKVKLHGKDWKPGGKPGKLHDELGVPKGDKIPAAKLEAATHSSDPEVARDAVRAETMKGWDHSGGKGKKRKTLYGNSKGMD